MEKTDAAQRSGSGDLDERILAFLEKRGAASASVVYLNVYDCIRTNLRIVDEHLMRMVKEDRLTGEPQWNGLLIFRIKKNEKVRLAG